MLHFRVDGEPRPFRYATDGHADGRLCPQQVLVRNLVDVFVGDGGDLRFEAEGVELADIAGPRPRVRYRDGAGVTRTIGCNLVAGCDGEHGVSRASVPSGELTSYSREHGYAWLSVLADAPAGRQTTMAIHDRGFASQFPRGGSRAQTTLWFRTGIRFLPGLDILDIAEKFLRAMKPLCPVNGGGVASVSFEERAQFHKRVADGSRAYLEQFGDYRTGGDLSHGENRGKNAALVGDLVVDDCARSFFSSAPRRLCRISWSRAWYRVAKRVVMASSSAWLIPVMAGCRSAS